MVYILYFFVTLTATTIGALTGMGGGVIIKPALDALSGYDAATINLLSSVTVFVMALVSVIKQIRQKAMIDHKMVVFLGGGSLLGGYIGQRILEHVMAAFQAGRMVVAIQNICLTATILTVALYMRKGENRPTLGLRGMVPALLTGTFMGMISSFLGIGGGPINVALLIFVCSSDIKTATLHSIITILLAQTSKLASIALSGAFLRYDTSVLPVMIAGAVLGGLTGSHFSKRFSEKTVEKAFGGVQILVFLICLFNIARSLNP